MQRKYQFLVPDLNFKSHRIGEKSVPLFEVCQTLKEKWRDSNQAWLDSAPPVVPFCQL